MKKNLLRSSQTLPVGTPTRDDHAAARFLNENNLVENVIRPTALGKKNWLFIGDAQAGDRGAILYTIVESCRRRGVEPFTYLRNVLTRLPHMTNHQIKDITPSAWAKSQKVSALKLAS